MMCTKSNKQMCYMKCTSCYMKFTKGVDFKSIIFYYDILAVAIIHPRMNVKCPYLFR